MRNKLGENYALLTPYHMGVKMKEKLIIDPEEYEELSKHRWTFHGTTCLNEDGKNLFEVICHKYCKITLWPKFKNGNYFDYRFENFDGWSHQSCHYKRYRQCLRSNTFVKGVTKRGSKYRARVWSGGRTITIGTFSTQLDAANAVYEYDRSVETTLDRQFSKMVHHAKKDPKLSKLFHNFLKKLAQEFTTND